MAPPTDRVYTLARTLLDVVVTGYAMEGVELPDRQLVLPGLPAFDCALLGVWAERIYNVAPNLAEETMESAMADPASVMRGCTYSVVLLRCVPTPDVGARTITLPAAQEEEAAAVTILTDAQLLANVVRQAQRDGDLPGCNGVAWEDWQQVGPEGGLAGGVFRLRMGLA